MSRFKPVSFAFVTSGLAIKAKANLCAFTPSRTNPEPSWEGRRGELKQGDLIPPITDIGYWQDRYVLTEIMLENSDGLLFLNDAVIYLDRAKEIVTTKLPGLAGTVKEFITQSDYNIKISVGIVAVENGQIVDKYPSEGIKELRKFLDTTAELKITGNYIDLFGINKIVITKYSIIQNTASNRQEIEIEAVSDEDFTINSEAY